MAEYRKIIRFGKNSLIVSLPKSWASRNNLEPGDSLRLETSENGIILSPGRATERRQEERTYRFSVDNVPLDTIKRNVISAYLNNADVVLLTGREIPKKNKDVREFMHQLVSLEIIEESAQRIQARCYLNMRDIQVGNLVRKIDAILKSSFLDVISRVEDPNKFSGIDIPINITERDWDVNRLAYLVMRAVKYLLDHPRARDPYQTNGDLLHVWDLVQTMEKIGDELKRLARLLLPLDDDQTQNLTALLKKLSKHYDALMSAYYRKDVPSFHTLALERDSFTKAFDAYQERHESTIKVAKAVEKAKSLFYRVDELSTLFDTPSAADKGQRL